MRFSGGTPLPSLGVDGPDLPGRISVERPIAPRCGRHLPSSRPGSLRWSAPSPTEIGLGCDAKFFSVPSATPPLTGVRPHTSPYACSIFLARVFPGGRASGSVWLTDWPISWGEHTLSPSLRVVHQKIKIFFLPSKIQTRVDGPALGHTGHSCGESGQSALVRRKSTMEEH